MCGAFSGRATSTAAVGVVHDSFISYSDGRRHRWSHNPFCVNRHDIFQNSTAEQRQFNEPPSQRHVFCGKRHATTSSVASRTRRQGCGQEEAACGRRGRQTQQRGQGAGGGQCSNREHRPCPRKIKAHGGARCASSRRPPHPRKIKALKRSTQEWQDPRAVHDLRGTRSERGPFVARSSRGVSPNARLQGFSDARRAYLAEASSFWMRGGDMLPRTGAFPVRGPFGNA